MTQQSKVVLINPAQNTIAMFTNMGAFKIVNRLTPTNQGVVVIDDLARLSRDPEQIKSLEDIVRAGNAVLLLHPGQALADIFPEAIAAFHKKEGEIVSMGVPESTVFSGIEPLDLSWFGRGERKIPLACTGVFQINSANPAVVGLASQLDLHGYLKTPSEIRRLGGMPIVEWTLGKGHVLASEMNLESEKCDPIARKLLVNMITTLAKDVH